jgi:hypothetical protein
MRMTAIVVSLLLLCQAGQAQSVDPGQIVRGLCQKDGCAEFAILDKQPVANGTDGQLFRTKVQTFHASQQGRMSQGVEDGFVYCSQVRPAVISTQPGQPIVALFLAPDDRRPSWALRGTTNFVAIYFAICHGVEAGRSAALDRSRTAESFGYHVALDQPRQATLKQVQDILQPSGALPP